MSHKPRGRKPRGTPTRVFRAQTLWGFGQRPDDHSPYACDASVPLCVGGAWGIADQSPVSEYFAGHTEPFAATCVRPPCRRAKAHRHQRQVVARRAAHNAGGARMACPRMRQCRMVIAWPQCRQTKVGGDALGSSSARSSLLGVAATWPGATSNN